MNEAAILAAIPAVIAAMGGIIKLVLNAMERIEGRQEKFLTNHMSKNTQALEDLAESVTRLRIALEQTGVDTGDE